MRVAFIRPLAVGLLLCGFFLGTSGSLSAMAKTPKKTAAAPAKSNPTWASVKNFTYILQNENTTAIGNTKFNLVIIDLAHDGDDSEGFYTKKEITALKNSPGGPKLVLAYLSIGEAETYRSYWQSSWAPAGSSKPSGKAPSWLGPAIYPEWPDNYTVRYWDPQWQAIIMNRVDQAIAAGFDGVYLDRIDTYEYWQPDGQSGANRQTAPDEMISFVKAIALHARMRSGNSNFGVFPQGGFELAEHPDYVSVCTGIGNEDNWYDGNHKNSQADTYDILKNLDHFKSQGKLVLVTDYVTQQALIDDFYAKAQAKGYVPYATVRALNRLTINKGHEPTN